MGDEGKPAVGKVRGGGGSPWQEQAGNAAAGMRWCQAVRVGPPWSVSRSTRSTGVILTVFGGVHLSHLCGGGLVTNCISSLDVHFLFLLGSIWVICASVNLFI